MCLDRILAVGLEIGENNYTPEAASRATVAGEGNIAPIDLKNNKLVLGNTEVTFLSESEIPKNDFAAENKEVVKGQDGAIIDANTGTVKQAPASIPVEPVPSSATASSVSQVAPATPRSTTAGLHSKDKIDQLVSLGFSAEQANAALDATNGDVEYAAGLLFHG